MKSIVLVSGGLDSCVTLAWARAKLGENVVPMMFSYGQTHAKELSAAAKILEHYKLEENAYHVRLDMSHIRAGEVGQLLADKLDVKAAGRTVKDQLGHEVSATFVPGRNIIFLAYAGSLADQLGIAHIALGVNAVDYSGYPDCRPDFIKAMNLALIHGLRRPVTLWTPLISLEKKEIIKLGMELEAPLHLTWSCYAGGDSPCGKCPSCIIRVEAFKQLGKQDPALKKR